MLISILLYAVLLYLALMVGWILWHLLREPVSKMLTHDQNNLRGTGITFSEKQEKDCYTVIHTIEDGIERIVYSPKERKHETPILMAHGMWHGAWCWRAWQEFLAERGWESTAYSLPGHGKSPLQRSLTTCTLGYYLAFVRDEINRLPRKPVLMGHSMGGALSQWYLKYIGDDLPAVVLVAPWVSHNALIDGLPLFLKLDPLGCFLMFFTWNAGPLVRSPKVAAKALMTETAMVSPEELHGSLNGESGLVMFQQSPPGWKPAENAKMPMLLLAGEKDAVVSVEGLRKSAAHYKANFMVVPDSAHNLMMEKTYLQTADKIDTWLTEKKIA
jgi:pimeloyl-ACP methyl ester carboxylesterase